MTKNCKKITAENFFIFFFDQKLQFTYPSASICPSYRRSLQFSKEGIQHFKTWTFTNYCLLLWVIFALLDPDPDPQTRLNTDPIWIRIPDPDPQPCLVSLSANMSGAHCNKSHYTETVNLRFVSNSPTRSSTSGFFLKSVPKPLGPFQIFRNLLRYIRSSRCTTGFVEPVANGFFSGLFKIL